jgi:hypothetical protein
MGIFTTFPKLLSTKLWKKRKKKFRLRIMGKMKEVKKKMGYVYSNFSVIVRESPCNHLCFY